MNMLRINIAEKISENLALRDANELFDYLDNLDNDSIELDFINVKSISRSFAHQYIIRKEESKNRIKEINLSSTIRKMFDIVSKNKDRKLVLSIKKIPISSL